MGYKKISLEVRVGPSILSDARGHKVAAGGAEVCLGRVRLIKAWSPGEVDKVSPALGPCASGRSTYYGQAGVHRRALEGALDHAKGGLHTEPLQRVVAVHFCRVGPVRAERTIINFAVRQ